MWTEFNTTLIMISENFHRPNEMIEKTSDQKTKQALKDALGGMRHEIKDGAKASKTKSFNTAQIRGQERK